MTTYSNSFRATQTKQALFNLPVTDEVQSFLINKELGHSITAKQTGSSVVVSLVAKSGDVLSSIAFDTYDNTAVESMTYNSTSRIIDTKLLNGTHIYCSLQALYDYADQKVATEAAERQAADTTLLNNINTEASIRSGADQLLLTNINTEASTRAAADTTLTTNLANETLVREALDTQLAQDIEVEESRAVLAEILLSTALLAEVTNRTNTDITLTQSITNETTARQTADEGLQASINTKASQASVDSINEKIPTQATSSNLLADKDFVNSSINSVTAFYITKNAAGDQFSTKAELDSTTTFYSGGVVRVPTRNDYCIVLSDETHSNATTRYIYYNAWQFQYKVNDTPFTAAQLAAINSGVTSSKVADLDSNTAARHTHNNKQVLDEVTTVKVSSWDSKQEALVSGTNIKTINNQSLLGSGDIQVVTDVTISEIGIPGQTTPSQSLSVGGIFLERR